MFGFKKDIDAAILEADAEGERRNRARINGELSVAVQDVTGDGRPDIVLADRRGVRLMVNMGDGKFAPPVFIHEE